MSETVSDSFHTLIKLCYTKALEWSSQVPGPEAKSSSEITNLTLFTVSYHYWTPSPGESSKVLSVPASRLTVLLKTHHEADWHSHLLLVTWVLTWAVHAFQSLPSSTLWNGSFKSWCSSLFALHLPSLSWLTERRNNSSHLIENERASRGRLANLLHQPPWKLPPLSGQPLTCHMLWPTAGCF